MARKLNRTENLKLIELLKMLFSGEHTIDQHIEATAQLFYPYPEDEAIRNRYCGVLTGLVDSPTHRALEEAVRNPEVDVVVESDDAPPILRLRS